MVERVMMSEVATGRDGAVVMGQLGRDYVMLTGYERWRKGVLHGGDETCCRCDSSPKAVDMNHVNCKVIKRTM